MSSGRMLPLTGHPFGIDFGGTGIKGAPVDLDQGDFAQERVRIKMPTPSTPAAVAEVFVELLGKFPDSDAPVGVTVPGVVQHGVVRSAANIDEAWVDSDADALFTEAPAATCTWSTTPTRPAWRGEVRRRARRQRPGDRDHAGHGHRLGDDHGRPAGAELRAGAPRGRRPRRRVPGSATAPASARTCRGRTGRSGSPATTALLLKVLFSPDLFVVGGGVSKHAESFLPLLEIRTRDHPGDPAQPGGVVGAAPYASESAD